MIRRRGWFGGLWGWRGPRPWLGCCRRVRSGRRGTNNAPNSAQDDNRLQVECMSNRPRPEPRLQACGRGDAPSHGGGVVGQAEASVGAEQDDAAVSAETVIEVGNGFMGGEFGGCAGGDAVGGPLAEDQLHDGFAPSGERDGGGEIVGVAAAADQRGVADTAGSFVERATGGGGGGEVAAGVESDGANGVVGVVAGGSCWVH